MTLSAGQIGAGPPAITYLDGPRLRRALRAGIGKVVAEQDRLNKINVYPVPDGDTGTNLALTLQSVLGVITAAVPRHAGQLMMSVADAALDGARGNSGAIFAQFLQGVSDHCQTMPRLYARELAGACSAGATYAREAMSQPVEGTLLTVLDDFAKAIETNVAQGEEDLARIFLAALVAAESSLRNTPNLLDVLRKAGVVDAGAAGFVDLLQGIDTLLKEGTHENLPESITIDDDFVGEMAAGEAIDLRFRYCTECLITGREIDRRKLREDITAMGDSLVIAGSHAKMRVHIHTNVPSEVFEVAAAHGVVSGQKADDMRRQQGLTHSQQRGVVITTDTAGDIPDEEVERLNIYLTPVRVHFGEQSYLDKVTITAEQLYRKLRTETVTATTSQPAPGDFRRQFQFLSSHYRDVVSVHVTARASGTWQAAHNVASTLKEGNRVYVVDSASASVGQGLLVIDAAEAALQGYSGAAVVKRIEMMKQYTQTYAMLRDLSYVVRGGRLSGRVQRVADVLHLVPVLGLRKGRLKPVGALFGHTQVVEKFARFVSRRISPQKRYRLAVGHADCEQDARLLLRLLESAMPNRQQTILTRLGTALGVHAGPLGLVVGVQEYRATDL